MASRYDTLLQTGRSDEVHERVTFEAASLIDARRLLEGRYPGVPIVSLRGEVEANRPR